MQQQCLHNGTPNFRIAHPGISNDYVIIAGIFVHSPSFLKNVVTSLIPFAASRANSRATLRFLPWRGFASFRHAEFWITAKWTLRRKYKYQSEFATEPKCVHCCGIVSFVFGSGCLVFVFVFKFNIKQIKMSHTNKL